MGQPVQETKHLWNSVPLVLVNFPRAFRVTLSSRRGKTVKGRWNIRASNMKYNMLSPDSQQKHGPIDK